jgi:hypothetical protein
MQELLETTLNRGCRIRTAQPLFKQDGTGFAQAFHRNSTLSFAPFVVRRLVLRHVLAKLGHVDEYNALPCFLVDK